MEQKILKQSNKYENGKRIYVQTVEEIRSKADDYIQIANFYSTLAQYVQIKERLISDTASDPQQVENVEAEIKNTENAIMLLQEYIEGYENGNK